MTSAERGKRSDFFEPTPWKGETRATRRRAAASALPPRTNTHLARLATMAAQPAFQRVVKRNGVLDLAVPAQLRRRQAAAPGASTADGGAADPATTTTAPAEATTTAAATTTTTAAPTTTTTCVPRPPRERGRVCERRVADLLLGQPRAARLRPRPRPRRPPPLPRTLLRPPPPPLRRPPARPRPPPRTRPQHRARAPPRLLPQVRPLSSCAPRSLCTR